MKMGAGVGGQQEETKEVKNISNQSTSAIVANEMTPVGPWVQSAVNGN